MNEQAQVLEAIMNEIIKCGDGSTLEASLAREGLMYLRGQKTWEQLKLSNTLPQWFDPRQIPGN